MQPRPTSDPQRDSRETSRTAVTALERRIAELEQLTDSQSRELRIQFERIAQMQAEWDILRIRFINLKHTTEDSRTRQSSLRRDRCAIPVSATRRPLDSLQIATSGPTVELRRKR